MTLFPCNLRGEKRQKQKFPYDEYLYNLMGKLLQKNNPCE